MGFGVWGLGFRVWGLGELFPKFPHGPGTKRESLLDNQAGEAGGRCDSLALLASLDLLPPG